MFYQRSVDDTMITKKELYTENKDLVCKMWATFGEYAEKHGYAPWNDYDCSDYSMKLVGQFVASDTTCHHYPHHFSIYALLFTAQI